MRLALGFLLAIAPFAASAAPVINDASFEAPVTASYTYAPTGTPWSYAGPSGVAANGGPFYTGSAPDGTQAAFIQSSNSGIGTISQVLTGLTIGTNYSFSFFAAGRVGFSADPIDVTFNSTDLGTYTPLTNTFAQFTTTAFNATATTGLLAFSGTATSLSDIDTAIDLASLNTLSRAVPPIPEPASMALLATGLVAVSLRRSRARPSIG